VFDPEKVPPILSRYEKLSLMIERDSQRPILNKYVVRRMMIPGETGNIFDALSVCDRRRVQIRVVLKSEIRNASTQSRIQREVDAASSLSHPSISALIDFFSDQSCYYLVSESSCAGTLDDALQNKRRIPERDASYICRQLISALRYCHLRSVFHRRLRPSSVLVTHFPKVKLCDFGSCVFAPRCTDPPPSSLCFAPEEVLSASYSAAHADVWALGVCVYQMVIGSTPPEFWRDGTRDQIMHWADTLPDDISEPCRDVIRATMQPIPAHRASLEALLEMTWLRAGIPRIVAEDRMLIDAMRPNGPMLVDRPMPKRKIGQDEADKPVEWAIAPPEGEFPRIVRRVVLPVVKRPATMTLVRRGQILRPTRRVLLSTLR
jgi:serine/threonine protein kinase